MLAGITPKLDKSNCRMPDVSPTANQRMVRMMTHYMAWANTVMLNSVSRLPNKEIVKER